MIEMNVKEAEDGPFLKRTLSTNLPGFRVQHDKAKYWFVTNVSNIFCISQKMSCLGQQVPAGIHAYDNDAPYLQKKFHDFAKAETFWIRLRIRSICV